MNNRLFRNLAQAAFVLSLVVIVMGAWVRLSDAGLGCPDWPGCYGQLTWPATAEEVAQANRAYPERPVEERKAWREMVHRYAAGLLGLLVLAITAIAWRRRDLPKQPVKLPLFLLALVVFQAVLGMWTVTWQLKPLVVMGHLVGGFATAALLLWLILRVSTPFHRKGVAGVADGGTGGTRTPSLQAKDGLDNRLSGVGASRRFVLIALVILSIQIALGGWTSANYAALSCPDFPTCQGQWWPETDFEEAFVLWRGLGVNYEFGVLDAPARNAIQLTHRLGALVTTLVLGSLALLLLARGRRTEGAILLALLGMQIALGIANVLMRLPMPVAVGHNAMALALLLWLVFLLHRHSGGTGAVAA